MKRAIIRALRERAASRARTPARSLFRVEPLMVRAGDGVTRPRLLFSEAVIRTTSPRISSRCSAAYSEPWLVSARPSSLAAGGGRCPAVVGAEPRIRRIVGRACLQQPRPVHRRVLLWRPREPRPSPLGGQEGYRLPAGPDDDGRRGACGWNIPCCRGSIPWGRGGWSDPSISQPVELRAFSGGRRAGPADGGLDGLLRRWPHIGNRARTFRRVRYP